MTPMEELADYLRQMYWRIAYRMPAETPWNDLRAEAKAAWLKDAENTISKARELKL